MAAKVKVWKVIASAVCWTLSVLSALLAGAIFASGSVLCRGDHPDTCTPQTWALVIGVILAAGFAATLRVVTRNARFAFTRVSSAASFSRTHPAPKWSTPGFAYVNVKATPRD